MVLEELAVEAGDEGHETGERGVGVAVGLPIGLGNGAVVDIGGGDIEGGMEEGLVGGREHRGIGHQQGGKLADEGLTAFKVHAQGGTEEDETAEA